MGGQSREQSKSTLPWMVAKPVGQQIESIYQGRLRQLTDSGQYYHQGLRAKFYNKTVDDKDHIELSVYSPPDLSRPTFKDATSHSFKSTQIGESFGPSWSTHWFKIKLTVPQEFLKEEHLEFHWDASNEGLVWSEDGHPLQGLTGGGDRIEWVLPKSFLDGQQHTFYIEMACNKMFGNSPSGDTIQPPVPDKYYRLDVARIVSVNLQARALYIDYWIIGDAAREFPGDSWEKHKALQVCNEIMNVFIAGDGSHESIDKARQVAHEYIGKDIDSEKVYQSGQEAIVNAIGHCHIDTCWLWPFAETKRKVARSWMSQCDLMDRYPEHRFTVSSAQQYKWLKEDYPSGFDRVKGKVKEGSFLPIGGSWVEHDTNLPSGESLVRQFLYGQRFFESHFGERCTTFWLPDTFGYSAQLPQLCRLAGMGRFFTQKLSWNNINKFPHTTFKWVSLDGSQVLCHMCPSETYTASAHFGDVNRSISQHKSLNQDNTSLLVFGYGDGGGGPTREMLDKLRRCRGISDKTGRLPRVVMGNTVDEFFQGLEKKAASGTEFVTWYGELYFELHRGTYTTQANNKRNNRKTEILLRDLEYVATLASLADKSYKYPKKDIDDMWESVLLCQFHDCLPGSSIEMCYDDSDKIYAKVYETGHKAKAKALSVLGLDKDFAKATKNQLVALSTLHWGRTERVEFNPKDSIPGNLAGAEEGQLYHVEGGLGVAPLSKDGSKVQVEEIRPNVFVMTNSHFKVEVESGCITSLIDLKSDREIVADGAKANQLVIFDDKPLYWQAWDVEVYHLESRKVLESGESRILEDGPYKVSIVTETQISEHSWAKTTITLDASIGDAPGFVTVDAEVEWRETMKFLKVEFPVDIVNTEASYETQFGIIRRPTHYNTTWDMAKFEVCCHKFADLSEAGYGVSILNESKYGFATCGNLMRLSLLRAPKAPDGHADMGRHHMRWAIMPHAGPLSVETVRAAYNFNNPMGIYRLASSKNKELFDSIRICGSDSLILDTIKRGEDDEDVSRGELPKRHGRSVVLRIYEAMGGKSRGTISTTLPVSKITKCNILEDDGEALECYGKLKCDVELRAFEVATFRLHLK